MPDFLQVAFTNFQEFGLVGAVIGVVLVTTSGLIWWVVKGMRADMSRANDRADAAQKAHLDFVMGQSKSQIEVLIAVANRLDRLESRQDRERNAFVRAIENQTEKLALVIREALTASVDQ